MRKLALYLATALVLALVFSAVAPAITVTEQKQNERITKLEANSSTKEELSAAKVALNERITALVTRVNGVEAHDNGQDPKIATLETKVVNLEKGSGGGEPPTEEPPAEEPPIEEPEPTGCSTTVSSIAAVQGNLGAGKVVCMAPGSYGTLSFTGPGTVKGGTFSHVTVNGTDGTIEGAQVSNGITLATGSTRATAAHNLVTGGGQGIDACPSDTTYCNEMRIIGNRLVGPFGEDAIHANRYHGLLVEGNEVTQVRENGQHSDCLQTVWGGDHLVYRRNYVHDNRCQGLFVKDQDFAIESIVFEDNLLIRNHEPCGAPLTSCGQPAIVQIFGPYKNLVAKRNTIWGDGADSGFYLREGVGPGTVIENNVIYRFWTDTNASGATFANNTFCTIEGSWPSPRPGTESNCSSTAPTPAGRGIDWSPAAQHYGP